MVLPSSFSRYRVCLVKYVALIPLRGGSRGIPRKNILPLAGWPLCRWTLEAAARTPRLERIYVATDSAEIRAVVESLQLPRVEVIDRGPETATDTASTESVMLEFAETRDFEHLVLIQATSPLLENGDLESALDLYESEAADSLVTVVEQKRFIWTVDETGQAQPQNYDPKVRPRRQDFSPYYVENGAFYISRREGLLREKSRLFGKIVAQVMPEDSFYELDEESDLPVLEKLLLERERRRHPLAERLAQIRLVCTDVDGVLTDSGMYYGNSGEEIKKFNTRDGKGLELLREAGLQVGIITAENTALVARRAAKLKMDFLYQGAQDKSAVLDEILQKTGLSAEQVAFIGDDLGDLPVLRRVGLAACPADAIADVREVAHFICAARGGFGCVRELAELILSAERPQSRG